VVPGKRRGRARNNTRAPDIVDAFVSSKLRIVVRRAHSPFSGSRGIKYPSQVRIRTLWPSISTRVRIRFSRQIERLDHARGVGRRRGGKPRCASGAIKSDTGPFRWCRI